MSARPRIAYDGSDASGARVRLWLLQLGAEPVDLAEPAASGLPIVPRHEGLTRAELASFVRALKGGRGPTERFDDHGSGESWPRGSF